MSILRKSSPVLALVAGLILLPAVASAQDQRFRVSFAPSVAATGGDAELALGGMFGYRFSEHFWFEGDVTWLGAAAGGLRDRHLEFDVPTVVGTLSDNIRRRGGMFGRNVIGLPTLPFPPIFGDRFSASIDGSTFIGTMGVRYELPVQMTRFRPYVSGGLGLNNTDQDLRIDTVGVHSSTSRTGFAFDGGAGASVRVWRQLWADMDAKYFRLSGDRDIMRLGGGVSYRF